MYRQKISLLFAFLLMLGIFLLSSNLHHNTIISKRIFSNKIINNILHIPVYGGLMLTWFLVFHKRPEDKKINLFFASGIAFSYGILIEIYQSSIPGRSAGIFDIILNLSGIIIGIFFINKFNKRDSLVLISHYFLRFTGFYFFRDLILKYKNRLPATILVYHRVNEVVKNGLTVSTRLFDKQMKILSKHYRVISLRELLSELKNGGISKRNTVVITFDDGYEDNYLNAAPILKKYNLPAFFFVTAGYINTDEKFPWDDDNDDSKVMTWNHVKRLIEMGFEIGSHTFSHPNLSKVSEKAIEDELHLSKKELEKRVGRKIDFFSYPFGKLDDVPPDFQKFVQKADYSCCCSAHPARVFPDTDIFKLPRKPINEVFHSAASFHLEINGGREYYQKLKSFFAKKQRTNNPMNFEKL